MLAILSMPALSASAPALAAEAEWVCPPCDPAHDEKVYDKPGACPVCGMALTRRGEMKNVAILIFEGVQIIDYTGPYEVLGQVAGLDVFTVSDTGKTITTAMGMSVNPRHSFETAPEPDIIVVPGGHAEGAYENPRVISWLQEKAARAAHVLSVCNGAFILAKAGLLDGKKATTFYGLIDELREFAPKTEVVTDQRFVDNGQVITSAGLSSGIDAALHLVSKMKGEARAKELALHLEYDWDPESKFARAALADMRLPRIAPPPGAQVTVVASAGDRDRWERRFHVRTDMTLAELRDYVSGRIASLKGWARGGSGAGERSASGSEPPAGSRIQDAWTYADADGSRWESACAIEPDGEGAFHVTLTIRRTSPDLAL